MVGYVSAGIASGIGLVVLCYLLGAPLKIFKRFTDMSV